MAENVLSLSMSGKSYCLCGKAYYRCRAPETLTKEFKPDQTNQYISFGPNGSWYRSFKRKNTTTKKDEIIISLSPNFATVYPSLSTALSSNPALNTTPNYLSLGPNGRFFANIGGKKLWKLPKTLEDRLGNLLEYEAVWLGKEGKGGMPAYVAVRKDGGFSADLGGGYEGLLEAIRDNGAPKVLAMDIEGGKEWVGVWPNGSYKRRSGACLPSEDANIFFEKMGFKSKNSAAGAVAAGTVAAGTAAAAGAAAASRVA